jgi:uncharacterized protein (TIGR01777 family)
MTYLVTGATGFIGRKLVAALLAGGHAVNYLGRRRDPALDSRAAFYCWNPGEKPPLNSVPPHEAVIHLAGEPLAQRWTSDVKRRIRQSRVDATRDLVSGYGELRHRPEVMISASAIGYYGDRGGEVLTEESRAGNRFLADVCVGWEREARNAEQFGIRVVPIRIAAVLGRDGGALPRMLKPFRLGLGGKFGSGRQWMSWIHIDDLVRLIRFASESNASGPWNGSSPNPVTNAEFTRALAKALGRPAPWSVPKFALRIALGEMADFLFDSARVIPQAATKAGFRFEYPEINMALRSLIGEGPANAGRE